MRDLGHAVLRWDRTLTREECRRVLVAADAIHRAFRGRQIPASAPSRTGSRCCRPSAWRRTRTDQPSGRRRRPGMERFAEIVTADVAVEVAAIHADPAARWPVGGASARPSSTATCGS